MREVRKGCVTNNWTIFSTDSGSEKDTGTPNLEVFVAVLNEQNDRFTSLQ